MKLSDSQKVAFSKTWGTLLLVLGHFVSQKRPCRGMPVPCFPCACTYCTPILSSVHNPDPASSAPAAALCSKSNEHVKKKKRKENHAFVVLALYKKVRIGHSGARHGPGYDDAAEQRRALKRKNRAVLSSETFLVRIK